MRKSTAGDSRAARRRPVPVCRSATAHPECSGAQLAARARNAGGLYGVDTEHDPTGRCVNNEFVREQHAVMVGCGEPCVPWRLQYVHCCTLTMQEGVMALSKAERCRELARLVGIPLMEGEVAEVAERFESLVLELERLTQLDLVYIQPVLVFPEEEA